MGIRGANVWDAVGVVAAGGARFATMASTTAGTPPAAYGRARLAFNARAWRPDADEWQFALSLVPPDAAARVMRFRRESDRKLALGSRLAAAPAALTA